MPNTAAGWPVSLRAASSSDSTPSSRTQCPSRCSPKPASLKKVRCAPASDSDTKLAGCRSMRPTAASSELRSSAVNTVSRLSSRARSSMKSSGSLPTSFASSAIERVGLARGVEVLEHRVRIGAAVKQGGNHHRPGRLRRQLLEERHPRVAALGEHEDAAAGVLERDDEGAQLLLVGQT